MEMVRTFPSMEAARNAAIAWLQGRGAVFGPYRRVEIGRLGALAGNEVGVSSTEKPYWRLRLDYDPSKGPLLITRQADLLGDGDVAATDVHDLILRHLGVPVREAAAR